MKTLKQHLINEFKKLVPYQELTAPEIAAILQANKKWLQERLNEKEKDFGLYGKGLTSQIEYYQKSVKTISELIEELKQ